MKRIWKKYYPIIIEYLLVIVFAFLSFLISDRFMYLFGYFAGATCITTKIYLDNYKETKDNK